MFRVLFFYFLITILSSCKFYSRIQKDESGDYKIPYAHPTKSKDDDGFAYCDSKEDAIGTAKSMYKKVDNVIIKLNGKVILHKEDGANIDFTIINTLYKLIN